jgi:hypothetical protein
MSATQFKSFLGSFPEEVHPVAQQLRKLVLSTFDPPVEEHDGENYGFGFAPGYKGLVLTISPAATYVRLGLAHAAGLADPDGLMQGAGKVHRHVKVGSVAEAKAPALRALVEAAYHARATAWNEAPAGPPTTKAAKTGARKSSTPRGKPRSAKSRARKTSTP